MEKESQSIAADGGIMAQLPPAKASAQARDSVDVCKQAKQAVTSKLKWIHDSLHPYKKINERYRNRA